MRISSYSLLLRRRYLLFAGFALLMVLCGVVLVRFFRVQKPEVIDVALETGFQGNWFGHFKRGRALVAADFDLDGRPDFFLGNPGDESYIIRNTTEPNGRIHFELVQVLLKGELAWGAAAADYDNDGDYDLFVAVSSSEDTPGYDRLFKNLWMESGQTRLSFADATDAARVRGPQFARFESTIPIATTNAVWGDYDRDGDVDLFVSVNLNFDDLWDPKRRSSKVLRNILWRNNGDGTFTDVTEEVGLGASRRPSQHSTLVDIDNDGDLDLYENNFGDRNVLWRNMLVEAGKAYFVDVTQELSNPPTEDLSFPIWSFASAAADFNNDGWQDLIVFMYRRDLEPQNPYGPGHLLFLNQGGKGFVNVANKAGINKPFQKRSTMGCQVGDLNGDGVPDIYIGRGTPLRGEVDQLYMSDSKVGQTPHYLNRTDLIDFPAPEDRSLLFKYPPYPYRSQGINFVDVDGDGLLEAAVVSGGPARKPDEVREPNRLFKVIHWENRPNYFKVRPVGNGTTVSRDAIGTRFALTVSRGNSTPWTLYNTLFAGSCFSAQQGFEVYFGLKDADTIHSLEVTWPDGFRQTISQRLSVNSSVAVMRETGEVIPAATVKPK